MKKDKNVSIPIKIQHLIQQIARPQYLTQFSQNPQFLACQIDDLKTIINFSLTNYTNKAKQILKISKQYNKSIQLSIDQVRALNYPAATHFQQSYPQLAYETFKQIKQYGFLNEHNSLTYFQTISTQMKLKFIESEGIQISDWQKYYNQTQRQIQTASQLCKLKIGLKLENKIILWALKGVLYNNNPYHQLFYYYQVELIPWFRGQYSQIKQSQMNFLSFMQKSLNYIQIILLFLKHKQKNFNQQLNQQDKRNGILNIFPLSKKFSSQTNQKNIKLHFNLINSINHKKPSIQLIMNEFQVLEFYFIENQQNVCITVNFKVYYEENQYLKVLKGIVQKNKITIDSLIDICYQVISQIDLFQNLVTKKVGMYKMDIFQKNNNAKMVLMLNSTNCLLYQESIFDQTDTYHNQLKSIILKKIQLYYNTHGIFISLAVSQPNQLQQQYDSVYHFLTINTTVVSILSCLMLKSQHTQSGFVDYMLSIYPSITYQECMRHLMYYNLVITNHFNWLMKFTFIKLKKQQTQINYLFDSNINRNKRKDLKQYQKKDIQKQYQIYIKISLNFQKISFKLIQTIVDSNNKDKPMTTKEIYLQSHYFKDSWNQYIKNRNQMSTEDYLDVKKVFKTTYYLMNHWETHKKIQENQQIPKRFILSLAQQ